MIILSHNCLAGFIYRDILHEKYNHPFIWSFVESDFCDFIQNFRNIDFNNVYLESKNGHCNGIMTLHIDDKLIVRYSHVKFDKNADVPYTQDVNVYTNEPWKYVLEKYEKRLNLMDKNDDVCVIMYEPTTGLPFEFWDKLYNVCTENKFRALFITDKYDNENEYVKIIKQGKVKNIKWEQDIIKMYGTQIKDFIYEKI